jgi:hypothetical protein
LIFVKKKSYTGLLSESEIKKLIYSQDNTNNKTSNKLVQQGKMGEHQSLLTGSGGDFADLRAYHAGDDIRHIDWRATARSQTPSIKTFHREFSQPICLLIDRRSSMRFATRSRLKVTQALRMALWQGGQEARAGREISAVILDEQSHWLAPGQGFVSLEVIAKLANKPCPPQESKNEVSWKRVFSGLQQHIPQGSELLIVSDFYGLNEGDNKYLRNLARHCQMRAIQIIDPSEDPESDRFYSQSFFSLTRQLFWHQLTHILALNSDSAKQFKQALNVRMNAIHSQFKQANIELTRLSVTQDSLNQIASVEKKL